MSEPVTNVQIEDVLSSVRRLLSSGKPEDAPDQPLEEANPEPAPERFVLTPALRVTDDEVLESETSADESDSSVANEEEQPDAAEDETTIVFDANAPLVLATATDVSAHGGWDIEPEHTATEVSDNAAAFDDGATSETSARDTLEATIAELEAAVIAQPDEWEPDGSEVTSIPTWETASYPPLDEVEDAEAVEETSPAEMRGDVPEDTTPDDDLILSSGPVIAEEAPPSELHVVDDSSADVIGLTFAQTQPIPESPQADDEDEDFGDELAPDTDDTADIDAFLTAAGGSIDEEALRQLVVEIVRDELQGKLGERITRNVRKMVRREIHRALDMHGLD